MHAIPHIIEGNKQRWKIYEEEEEKEEELLVTAGGERVPVEGRDNRERC